MGFAFWYSFEMGVSSGERADPLSDTRSAEHDREFRLRRYDSLLLRGSAGRMSWQIRDVDASERIAADCFDRGPRDRRLSYRCVNPVCPYPLLLDHFRRAVLLRADHSAAS